MIAAGKYRHRITLQSKSVMRDAMGGETIAWTDEATVWALVEALSGRALMAAQQAQSEVTARILLRHRGDIQPDWRVLHGADVYAIHAIIPDATGQEINLQCARGLSNG
ncbi:MAG: phage head closure protein [Aeromonas veronii]